jgi:hypothetical protein
MRGSVPSMLTDDRLLVLSSTGARVPRERISGVQSSIHGIIDRAEVKVDFAAQK